MENSLSNDALHQKFVYLGKERHRLTHALLALLPEIFRRKIYKEKGYFSIYEYAGKLAGISQYVVDKAIGVAKDLVNKPFLEQAILTQGIHKVALVAKLATPQTDALWADKVKNMNKESLFELAREVRMKQREEKIDLNTPGNSDELTLFLEKCEAAQVKMKIDLDEETQILFLQLKKKIAPSLSNKEALRQMLERLKISQERSTKTKEGLDKKQKENYTENNLKAEIFPGKNLNNNILPNLSNGEIGRILSQKTKLNSQKISDTNVGSHKQHDTGEKSTLPSEVLKKISRYIPSKIKQQALAESDNRCAYPKCTHPAEIFHHTDRYAENKNHSSIIPLCKRHHQFAHNGLIKNEKENPDNWGLTLKNDLNKTDQNFRKIRQSRL